MTTICLTRSAVFALRAVDRILEAIARESHIPSPIWPKAGSFEKLELSDGSPRDVHAVGECGQGSEHIRFSLDFEIEKKPSVEEGWAIRPGDYLVVLERRDGVETFVVSCRDGESLSSEMTGRTARS